MQDIEIGGAFVFEQVGVGVPNDIFKLGRGPCHQQHVYLLAGGLVLVARQAQATARRKQRRQLRTVLPALPKGPSLKPNDNDQHQPLQNLHHNKKINYSNRTLARCTTSQSSPRRRTWPGSTVMTRDSLPSG